MLNEADTCRKYVVPRLLAAGWDEHPHSIAEQRSITDGRIVPAGKSFVRKAPKRVDCLLRYERNFPRAVVEAKVEWKTAGAGMQQAREYAEMLGLHFAYEALGFPIAAAEPVRPCGSHQSGSIWCGRRPCPTPRKPSARV